MKDLPDTPTRSLHPYGLRPCIYCLAVLPGMAAVIGCVTAIVATPALVIAGAVPSSSLIVVFLFVFGLVFVLSLSTYSAHLSDHTSYIMAPCEAEFQCSLPVQSAMELIASTLLTKPVNYSQDLWRSISRVTQSQGQETLTARLPFKTFMLETNFDLAVEAKASPDGTTIRIEYINQYGINPAHHVSTFRRTTELIHDSLQPYLVQAHDRN